MASGMSLIWLCRRVQVVCSLPRASSGSWVRILSENTWWCDSCSKSIPRLIGSALYNSSNMRVDSQKHRQGLLRLELRTLWYTSNFTVHLQRSPEP